MEAFVRLCVVPGDIAHGTWKIDKFSTRFKCTKCEWDDGMACATRARMYGRQRSMWKNVDALRRRGSNQQASQRLVAGIVCCVFLRQIIKTNVSCSWSCTVSEEDISMLSLVVTMHWHVSGPSSCSPPKIVGSAHGAVCWPTASGSAATCRQCRRAGPSTRIG